MLLTLFVMLTILVTWTLITLSLLSQRERLRGYIVLATTTIEEQQATIQSQASDVDELMQLNDEMAELVRQAAEDNAGLLLQNRLLLTAAQACAESTNALQQQRRNSQNNITMTIAETNDVQEEVFLCASAIQEVLDNN
jgi:hypothetical protein